MRDSCGLATATHYVLCQHGSSYLMWHYRSCKVENWWKKNKENCSHYGAGGHGHIRTENDVLCSIHIQCLMSFYFLSLIPLFVVFIGHHGQSHCNVFSLVISSRMQNSTNEEYSFQQQQKVGAMKYLELAWFTTFLDGSKMMLEWLVTP